MQFLPDNCHGFHKSVSRRCFLKMGSVAVGGLALAEPLYGDSIARTGKSVINIHLAGGPSHLDTFDLKPQTPSEYRGEFRPIATTVRGMEICELLPRLAALAGKFTIVRSVHGFRDEHSSVPLAAPVIAKGDSSSDEHAFDVSRENARTLTRYGIDRRRDLECFLAARRAIDAGVRSVSISWGRWDTHGNNFNQLRQLLPCLDQALSALIKDLDASGRLDDTLIVMSGEFGRTPRINNGAGRDHWPQASFVFLAGGGLRHGQVIGVTDRRGESPARRPIHVEQVRETVTHHLGAASGREISGAGHREPAIRELV